MTFLLVTKNTSPETIESLVIVSNSLVQTGHIVFIKFNEFQSFSGILFDNIIEISAPVRQLGRPVNPQPNNFSQVQQPNQQYQNFRPNTTIPPQIPQSQYSQPRPNVQQPQGFQSPINNANITQYNQNLPNRNLPANFFPQAPINSQADFASKPIDPNVNNLQPFKPF